MRVTVLPGALASDLISQGRQRAPTSSHGTNPNLSHRLAEEPREPHVSADLLAPRVPTQGPASHFRKPRRLGPPCPCPSRSHTVASVVSLTCPETEMPFSLRTATQAVGPVLYSLSEVPGGAAAAPGHPPGWGTGPHTPGPRAGCGRPALLGRCFLQPFRGLSGPVLFRSGLGLLGPRAHCTSCLPHPLPRFCLSIRFSRLFCQV